MDFDKLINYLNKVPSIKQSIGKGKFENGLWWIKFQINIEHPLSWQVIQEFGNVVNYLSVNERLPTTFYPVSPPSYLNGGPKEFLSWVIESTEIDFTPNDLQEWLEGRLPKPVENLEEWDMEREDDE
jgi:hypothetical protein